VRRCLTMTLSDARVPRLSTKLIYTNHRLPPRLIEDAPPQSLEPMVRPASIEDYCTGGEERPLLDHNATSYPVSCKNQSGANELVKWPPWKCFGVCPYSAPPNAKCERTKGADSGVCGRK
jgi:hypothetical protein